MSGMLTKLQPQARASHAMSTIRAWMSVRPAFHKDPCSKTTMQDVPAGSKPAPTDMFCAPGCTDGAENGLSRGAYNNKINYK